MILSPPHYMNKNDIEEDSLGDIVVVRTPVASMSPNEDATEHDEDCKEICVGNDCKG